MRWNCAFLCVVFSLVATLAQAADLEPLDFVSAAPQEAPEIRQSPACGETGGYPSQAPDGQTGEAEQVPEVSGAETHESYAQSIEWVGLQVGGGILATRTGRSRDEKNHVLVRNAYSGPMFMKIDLQFFNIQIDRIYVTGLEFHPSYEIGFLGGGFRVGYRLPLRPDYRDELRMGLYIGLEHFQADVYGTGFSLMPHFQYNHNNPMTSVGIGMDVPMLTTFDGGDNERRGDPYPFCGGVLFYVRVAFGRTRLVFSDY